MLVFTLPALLHAGVTAAVPAAPATVQAIDVRRLERIHSADAVIESVNQASVSAQISGRVLSVQADAGQPVRKGDVLARIDGREMAAGVDLASASVAQAQSRLVEARQQWERTRSLKDRNFVSQAAVDASAAALSSAEAAVQSAQSGRSMATITQSYAQVVAPIDGVVAARHVEPGDLAQPGRVLFVIHQPGALRAVATVPQALSADLGRARVAGVEVPALGKIFPADKVTVLPAADARLLSQRVRVDLPAGTGAIPGMAAKVQLVLGNAERLVVPQAAVLWRGEMSGVMLQGADGKAILRQVRLGETYAGGWVEVLAGVTRGELVLVPKPQ